MRSRFLAMLGMEERKARAGWRGGGEVSGRGGEGDGKEGKRVLPDAAGFEASGGEETGDGWGGEFVTVFGVDGLARVEVEVEVWAGGVGGDADVLGGDGIEVHLDAGVAGVPEGAVVEAG